MITNILSQNLIVCDTIAERDEIMASIIEGVSVICRETSKLEIKINNIEKEAGGSSGSTNWGNIGGTLSSQTDLNNALGGKEPAKGVDDNFVTDIEKTNLHAPGSDNQDLSGKVDKVVGSSLVADTEIAKIHSNTLDHAEVHNHDTAYEAKNANIQTHVSSAHSPSNAQANADITKAEIEAKLTGAISSHSHAGGGFNTLKKTADQTINSGIATFVDITDLTFPVVNGVDYAFFFYITFQSAASATGWKAGVNCPTGTLDFWAESQIVANGAAGVATHTERHNTVRDDMTLLTTTVTQAVDLAIRIEGRYKCTADGTFAARFANELSNTNLVVQKGSFGWWF